MSGTSADGIDAALVEIVEVGAGGGTLRVRTLAHCCVDYNPTFRQEIFSLFTPPESRAQITAIVNEARRRAAR